MISAYVWAQSLRSSVIESLKQEDGQDLIEYAVLAGAIGIVAAIAFIALPMGDIIGNFVNKVGACIQLDGTGCV